MCAVCFSGIQLVPTVLVASRALFVHRRMRQAPDDVDRTIQPDSTADDQSDAIEATSLG